MGVMGWTAQVGAVEDYIEPGPFDSFTGEVCAADLSNFNCKPPVPPLRCQARFFSDLCNIAEILY